MALHVGLLLDSLVVPAWTYQMLEKILGSDYAQLDLIILVEEPEKKRGLLPQRIWHNRRNFVYIVWEKLLKRLHNQKVDALEPIDASGLLADVVIDRVPLRHTADQNRVNVSDSQYLVNHKIDVFIRLGSHMLNGDILQAAAYGIWSYHHGDNFRVQGGPPGFWEVAEGHATTGLVLQVLTADLDRGKVLTRTFAATDPVSWARNRNAVYWKSLSILPRQLERLNRLGAERFFADIKVNESAPPMYGERLYKAPTNLECLRALFRLTLRLIRRKTYALTMAEQWMLLYRWSDEFDGAFWRYTPLLPPRDRFWADPFPVVENDEHYVFFEEYVNAKNRAHIAVLKLNRDGSHSTPQTVLEKPYHLSYPFIFRWDNRLFMIPESSENQTVDLYECERFPDKWRFCRNMLPDVHAVDATLVERDGKWWLFTNIAESKGTSTHDDLHLFFADSPMADTWTPHGMNPIVSDVRSARPAGRPFEYEGRLIRPSQNCSRRVDEKVSVSAYGSKLVFNEIVTLTEEVYKEEMRTIVGPNWDRRLLGIHTFNQAGGLAVADAKMRVPRWRV